MGGLCSTPAAEPGANEPARASAPAQPVVPATVFEPPAAFASLVPSPPRLEPLLPALFASLSAQAARQFRQASALQQAVGEAAAAAAGVPALIDGAYALQAQCEVGLEAVSSSARPELCDPRACLAACLLAVPSKAPQLEVGEDVPAFLVVDMLVCTRLLRDLLSVLLHFARTPGSRIAVAVSAPRTARQLHVELVVELSGAGADLGSGEALLRALASADVMSERAQRLALWLGMARAIAVCRLIEIVIDVKLKPHANASVMRASISLPYTLPSDAELAAIASAAAAAEAAAAAAVAAAAARAARLPAVTQPMPPPLAPAPLLPPLPSLLPGSAAVGSGEPLSQQIIADEDAVFGLDGEPLGLNVLFVDDQAIIRRLGDVFLRQLGCSVEVHEDGDEIVAALLQPRDKPFDAIVMDIVMRRSDGGEVCRVLREKHDVQLPIIAISSYASRKTLSAFYRDGFDVVLEKPFSREALGRALLEGRARRSALMRSRRLHTTPPELKSGTGSNGGACA